MSKAEVRRRLDEIVDFSGVERFLDTPVKRYSSGMYVRLAFAVAAHLEPEILVVDEVLSVGDVEFQKKCLGKMHSVAASSGRTVLFVSHSAAAVKALCDRVIVIDGGRVSFDGDVEEGLQHYQGVFEDDRHEGVLDLTDRVNPIGTGLPLVLTRLVIAGDSGPSSVYELGSRVSFKMDVAGMTEIKDAFYRIHFRNTSGEIVLATDSRTQGSGMAGTRVTFEIARLPLLPGVYTVDLGAGSGEGRKVLDQVEGAAVLRVEPGDSLPPGYNVIAEDGSIYLPPLWSSDGS
jgi:lipopolysaccharide transport system ATP-binding protein